MTLKKLLMSVNPTPESTTPDKKTQYTGHVYLKKTEWFNKTGQKSYIVIT